MGVFSVNLVATHAMMPNMIPIMTPPKATTKKDVTPSTISTAMMFSWPISAKDAKSRYKTF